MVNLIIDNLPDKLGGFSFNNDHKTVLRFYKLYDSEMPEDEKMYRIAELFFGKNIPETDEPWNELTKFIAGGEIEEDGGDPEKTFDFDEDGSRIYVSFLHAYNIDLIKESLHWWVFLELFKGLPEDTIIKKVMDIRGKKIKSSDSKEYRAQIAKAKAFYSLKKNSGGSSLGVLFNKG